jgi:hypothetical protein
MQLCNNRLEHAAAQKRPNHAGGKSPAPASASHGPKSYRQNITPICEYDWVSRFDLEKFLV